ncbi:Omega-amidase nit3 [Coemansia sp. RSA 2049]|nr:Omega-amidase nit3 [Coemansia sp. RSA 2049]KAJ2518339.1 Omega-amidase nit3 [Coemansia sp. RSA 1939]KAJ2608618.1 Omega-amidase nit3 [Coemansia sp. RSA 1804]KAJ2687435.1 Omega-amidase nit3 [Coemansia sp. RSA 1285]
MATLKLALIQLATSAHKATNLAHARSKVLEAAKAGANMVVLPECFNSPYGTQYFGQYSEEIDAARPSESIRALSEMARDGKVYLVGGSIPEREAATESLYNTCTVWNPEGLLIATHRKAHLFDIDFPGKIVFKESEVLKPGNKVTEFATPWGKFGVGICYDIRFPELAMIAARRGCVGMIYPGAFNTTTGPMHWELLLRARAMDNQIFAAACSPARDLDASYHAWGHSTVVDPFARVVATTGDAEDIVYADIDLALVDEVRRSIPIYSQRRFDIYPDVAADDKH